MGVSQVFQDPYFVSGSDIGIGSDFAKWFKDRAQYNFSSIVIILIDYIPNSYK